MAANQTGKEKNCAEQSARTGAPSRQMRLDGCGEPAG
jgi:hypothetical protein